MHNLVSAFLFEWINGIFLLNPSQTHDEFSPQILHIYCKLTQLFNKEFSTMMLLSQPETSAQWKDIFLTMSSIDKYRLAPNLV